MKQIKVRKFSLHDLQLQKCWEEWEKAPEISPFIYYRYSKFIYRYHKFYTLVLTPKILCATDENGNILMIMPLKKRIFGKHYLLSDIQGSGAAGCLCKPGLDEETKNRCLDAILEATGKKIKFQRVPPSDPLYKYFKEREGEYTQRAETACVSVLIPEKFEDLFTTLSSSNRQNIRTAYNRLNRDGKSFELKIFDKAESMSSEERKEIMSLYLKRLFTKYKRRSTIKRAIMRFKYRHIKHDTLSLISLDNAFHAILYIDGKSAGFLSGMTSHDQTKIVIPRLAIDINYKFYSPGYILLCETIKRLAADGKIKILDLSRGSEKYKLDIGGTEYYTHSFVGK